MRDFSSRSNTVRGKRVAMALPLFGSLALLLSLTAALTAWRDFRAVRARLDAVQNGLARTQTRLRSLDASRGLDQVRAAQALLTIEAPPPRVLGELGNILPPDVRLDSLSLGYGNGLAVDMQVLARTASSYDLFLTRLEESGLFENIVPGDENRDGEVRAHIQATYRGSGP